MRILDWIAIAVIIGAVISVVILLWQNDKELHYYDEQENNLPFPADEEAP